MKSLANSTVAVAYLRVSKEEQDLGPEAQRKAIDQWAARERIKVVAWHEDRLTSVTPPEKRLGFARALHDVKAHRAGWLVVAKRDRLARDVALIVAIEGAVSRLGARLACADGTPSGDSPTEVFQRQILDSVAQLERGFIRARTKAALDVKRERGERIGTVPYGFQVAADGRTLEECPAEQAVIQRAREIRDRGITFRGVASILDLEGHKSRRGTPFQHTQVCKMLGLVPRALPNAPLSETARAGLEAGLKSAQEDVESGRPLQSWTKPADDEAAHRERVRAIFRGHKA